MYLRRYVYDELLDILELRFYKNSLNQSPSMVILYGVHDGFLDVRKRPSVTVSEVCYEIHLLSNLVDDPHWKSFVKAHSITYSDNELFEA